MPKVKIYLFLQFILFSSLPVLAQVVDTAWVRRYNGPANRDDYATALAVDASGNVYVTGRSVGSSPVTDDYATIKYYPNGDTAWVRRYNGPGNLADAAYALAVDNSGNVYVTGGSVDSGSPYYDYATIKYNPNGDTAWVRRYNGPPGDSQDVANALAVDGSGNVYVTGGSTGSGSDADYATIKYYPNGDTAWVRRYNGPENSEDVAYALVVDASGNVYVTGASASDTSFPKNYDYVTIKYSSAGDTLWVRRYNGPGNTFDVAHALAVDDSGNVYVTGISFDSGTYNDYATIKYSSTGDTLWVRRYNNGPNDYATALAVDDSGNVYVTGQSDGSGSNYDYATIKYYPNGDTAWVRRYNGPENGADIAYALAVDASGNIYVTGGSLVGSLLGSHFEDYATIKYYPNGDTAWLRLYNGPGTYAFDDARALAVDGSGNVYVTGSSNGNDLYPRDYATIKYSPFYPLPIIQNDTLTITAYSPVNLVVTDPTNDSIGINFNTILEGSTYDTTQDVSIPPDGEKDDVVRIPKPYIGEYKIRVVPEDTGHYSLGIRIDGSAQVYLANNVVVPETSTIFEYSVLLTLKGDVNKDKNRNLTDIIFLVNYVFKGGTAPNPIELGNVNCSTGAPNLTDIIYMVNYVFKGGKPPCS